MIRKVLPTIAVGAICCFASATAQAQEMTMSLGTPNFVGRVAVAEPVTVSCSAFDPSLTLFAESVTVGIEQPSGRAIAHGSGTDYANPLFPCDGSLHTAQVVVSADPAGPPFHGGPAVFTASAGATAATPCPWSPSGCFTSPYENASASAGPTSLNLR
ncbi:MAG: hypothetical protein QOF83_3821 [Solirubrobacteraceae bacterium]|jgi:hypothetical protein|nr:hypothetical protein [Solirubrobacteraceae bacterium]